MSADELDLGLFSPLTVGEDFWEGGRAEAHAIAARTGLASGDSVLVIPRGVGQHAIALAELGLKVTAVGPDDDGLALAAARAESLELDIDFVVSDNPAHYASDASFDLVLNLSSSFDFVRTEDEGVAPRIFDLVGEDGWVILRMVSLDSTQRRVKSRDWSETKAGALLLEELEYDWSIGWVSYRWLVVGSDGRRYEFHLGHRGYDAEWIRNELLSTGFSSVELYGSLEGEPFESDTPLVVFARRAAGDDPA